MERLSCECKSLEEFYCRAWKSNGIIPSDIIVLEVVFRLETEDYVIIFTLPPDSKLTDVPAVERDEMELETIWKTYLRGASRYGYPVYKKVINMKQALVKSLRKSLLYKDEKKWRRASTLGMSEHVKYQK